MQFKGPLQDLYRVHVWLFQAGYGLRDIQAIVKVILENGGNGPMLKKLNFCGYCVRCFILALGRPLVFVQGDILNVNTELNWTAGSGGGGGVSFVCLSWDQGWFF